MTLVGTLVTISMRTGYSLHQLTLAPPPATRSMSTRHVTIVRLC